MEGRLSGIDFNEVLKYLGYKGGDIPAEITAAITNCANELMQIATPRIVYRIFDLLPDGSLVGTGFSPQGSDIRSLLSGCEKVLLFGATLGCEPEAHIRRLQVKNLSRALIFDCCASSAIENVCDNFCTDMQNALSPLYLTDRFSPGYGDMPFSQQADIIRLLDMPRRIGVSCTAGGLMVPQKSVTALIGLSAVPQSKRFRGCEHCSNFRNCSFRKENTFCGKE